MTRALDDAELAELAEGARAGMPPEAFAGVVALIGAELDAGRRARLASTPGRSPLTGRAEA